MSKYEEARNLAINGLEKALISHADDDVLSIDDGLDDFDISIPREELEPNSLLFLTLEFWSGWSDSAVHNWNFYEPLGKSDWPRLAKVVLSDLRENREITDQEILSQFSVYPKSRSSWLSKLIGAFRGKAI